MKGRQSLHCESLFGWYNTRIKLKLGFSFCKMTQLILCPDSSFFLKIKILWNRCVFGILLNNFFKKKKLCVKVSYNHHLLLLFLHCQLVKTAVRYFLLCFYLVSLSIFFIFAFPNLRILKLPMCLLQLSVFWVSCNNYKVTCDLLLHIIKGRKVEIICLVIWILTNLKVFWELSLIFKTRAKRTKMYKS